MRVLVACERSGKVRSAFRAVSRDAWSCDLVPSDDGSEFHLIGDALQAMSDTPWDLIIMHPPCTYLAISGNRWYGAGKEGYHRRVDAIRRTIEWWDTARESCRSVCMENPVGVFPVKPSQYIQPWQFGHGEKKNTGLWLHGLPKLTPTSIVDGREPRIHFMPPSEDRSKKRSETYQGIADAMAAQWSPEIISRHLELPIQRHLF
jgi:hypothetical protein